MTDDVLYSKPQLVCHLEHSYTTLKIILTNCKLINSLWHFEQHLLKHPQVIDFDHNNNSWCATLSATVTFSDLNENIMNSKEHDIPSSLTNPIILNITIIITPFALSVYYNQLWLVV